LKELDTTKPMLPVALTDREAQAVAGGALVLARMGGCPGCTSGGYLDAKAALGAIVNPVTELAAAKANAF
jgi:hypothetical protein